MLRLAPILLLSALCLAVPVSAGLLRDRIYDPVPMPAQRPWPGPAPQPLAVVTSDGLTLHGFAWPAGRIPGRILVFLHGNSGNQYEAARMAWPLYRAGDMLIVASYRGYGGNPGKPHEAGLLHDALAFIDAAQRSAPGVAVYLIGHSLGGAVALAAADKRRVAGVVTLGTFTRLADVAPPLVRMLLPDRYDNLAAAAALRAPLLVIHGTADPEVPFSHAEALRTAGRGRLLKINGGGHRLDLAEIGALVLAQISAMPPSPP